MLDLSRTRIDASEEMPVHSQYPITAEGLAVQHVMEDGLGKVRPSTGTANAIFVGVSMAQNMSRDTAVIVERVTVPSSAPLTVTLTRTPLDASAMLVKVVSTGAVLTYDAVTAGAGEFALSGATLSFHSGEAGATVEVVYRHALTVAEAAALDGDQPIGQTASAIIESVGVIKTGVIYTDAFDTSDDWAPAGDATAVIKAGANGRFQIGGTGADVAGRVIHAPTVDLPFLGIYIAF